ncbi:DUF2079 domain-containing protein [Vulcanococcus limneticus Candia 3F8]|uniref:DUF2079 domain-containing protein n=1 Tax=Vulcanococcus limneticus TaxID=2170428 RepID=UPI000B996BB6|nr:DUF2079 domain-containing protein [Vulcanococcus limneticus]MCP9792621.1 DUF2079 domain-containing protein [Vulcanococcus limneticus MW73D5]MCP9894348.1 DUF2079 domain-containing protein [Vulcanococcus limneticus Candia 3F8]MCP9898013.1 DUF2079 domain-containing protein [Vulcanococcus limneticus Candia 3B3]
MPRFLPGMGRAAAGPASGRLDPSVWLFFWSAFALYFGAVVLRHTWFQTSAWDLGIFDQAVYLIGQGLPPFSSFLGFHILGDHGALVLYPLGWIDRLLPSVYTLLALQSAALASAVFPLQRLAQRRHLGPAAIRTSLWVLVLYPVVFNTAIFDFHPETLAFPLVMQAIVLIEERRRSADWQVVGCLLLALTCKVSLALLVLGFGGWLLLQGRRWLGLVLCGLAASWLLLIGGWLIPAFGGEAASLSRHLGKFGLEREAGSGGGAGFVMQALGSLVGQLLSGANLAYGLLLLAPVLYLLLHNRRLGLLAGLLPFAPLLLLNLLASQASLKDLVHHYSLFLVPLLVAQVQSTLAPAGPAGRAGYPAWLRPRLLPVVVGWTLIAFVSLSRLSFFLGPFQDSLDNAPAIRQAIALVHPGASVVATNALAAHLARRPAIDLLSSRSAANLSGADQVLVDARRASWKASPKLIRRLLRQLRADPAWSIRFQRDDVWLFERRSAAKSPTMAKSRQQ